MDRRQFDREPTNLEVYAQAQEQPPLRLRARDISTQGIFVEGWTSPPRHGTEVSLTFLIGSGSVTRLLRRVARVTRVTDAGVGLMHGSGALPDGPGRRSPHSPWSSLRWPDVD